MIDKELLINVAGNEIKIFMSNNFFEFSKTNTSVHKHVYTELHCIESGIFEYTVMGERILAGPGDLIAIPENCFHSKRPIDEEKFCVCIFQTNLKLDKMVKTTLLPSIFTELLSCVNEYKTSVNPVKLSAHLALICSYFIDKPKNRVHAIRDREFIVYEFFTDYYRDLALSDLAKFLNLSEKQTERVVYFYTGRHFRAELAYRRIEAAKHMLSDGKMTLAEVAERVGYKSYSGFYKAYRKYANI